MIRLIAIVVWFSVLGAASITPTIKCLAQGTAFPIFDALLYKNKPDLTRFGIRPMPVAYASDLWNPGDTRDGVPSAERVQNFVRRAGQADLIVVDIEHWPLSGDKETVEESIHKYIETLERFKKTAPSSKIGLYSTVPQRAYWPAVLGWGSTRFRQWQRDNDAVKSIAEHADILFVSLYTFYPSQIAWQRYAAANLREARRIAPGKPIYCFLWPQYHDSTRRAYEFVPVEHWKVQLNTCRRLADGIVIWGGVGEGGRMNGWLSWNDNAPWWKVTIEFAASAH